MNSNLIEMLGNVSRSLVPVQHLLAGLAYFIGILFFIAAIQKFRKIGEKSEHNMFLPTAYLLGGAALLFLPSAYTSIGNTIFGVGNILQYSSYNPYDIYGSMIVLIRTAGLIWFIRGSVLLTHASEHGVQEGPKGLLFLLAGIFAMNFETTVSFLNYIMSQISLYTMSNNSHT